MYTTVYNRVQYLIIILFSMLHDTHYTLYITLYIYTNDIYRYTAEHNNTYHRRVCQ